MQTKLKMAISKEMSKLQCYSICFWTRLSDPFCQYSGDSGDEVFALYTDVTASSESARVGTCRTLHGSSCMQMIL